MHPVCVLDFGAHAVIALIAQKKKNGQWDVLGGGQVASQGVERGEIRHLGDAVECVTEALRRAEHSAGERIKTLYFNFDHASVEGFQACGTKHLAGEGQIGPQDILSAKEAALRTVASFERNVIYAKETGFLIDEKDEVLDPLGVYGRRLDAFLYVLTADSAALDDWNKVMRRSYVAKATPVFPVAVPLRRVAGVHSAAEALLDAAYEMEREKPTSFEGRHLWLQLKEKAASTWNEYF